MSFLNFPRLVFNGQFQADPSTVNNDPRHYSSASFEDRFQSLEVSQNAQTTNNGWWNPIGTSIFRFVPSSVVSLWTKGGKQIFDPCADNAFTLKVGNSPDRSSAKIVDLDPDWQFASDLFGLGVTLNDPSGKVVFSGKFKQAPFRDLWFARLVGTSGAGDMGASASYQSILTDFTWDIDGVGSDFLTSLKASADQMGALSIRFTTFNYNTDSTSPNFTYGSLLGAIGPYQPEEPKTFVLGRRFMPALYDNGTPPANPQGPVTQNTNHITCFSSAIDYVDGVPTTLSLDLSNALPVDETGEFIDSGPLKVVLLHDETVQENQIVTSSQFDKIGEFNDYKVLQHRDGGILTLSIPADAVAGLSARPLALVAPAYGDLFTVIIREVAQGLEVRAETFTFRLHSDDHGSRTGETVIHAAKYGIPAAGKTITFIPDVQGLDEANTPADTPDTTTPTASIPSNNAPLRLLDFTPEKAVTDDNGRATVTLSVRGALGSPREYLDGQIYTFDYNFESATETTNPKPYLDRLAVLVFSAYKVPEKPVWEDIQPILKQYANLYPIMSQQIFDFSDRQQAERNAYALKFAFSRDKQDTNYMPVTRDLSEGKRKTILTVLDDMLAENGGQPLRNAERFAARNSSAVCPMGHSRPKALSTAE